MKKYTLEELGDICPEAVMIGSEDERKAYLPAIIGIAKDSSHIAYSREKLVRCFMDENEWSWEEAEEWIEYNVERALPYYGEHAPVILNNNFISKRNKTYDGCIVFPKDYVEKLKKGLEELNNTSQFTYIP